MPEPTEFNPDTSTFTWAGVGRGIRSTLPLGLSVLAYGAVFGVLARQTGLSGLETGLMSGLVYAGAAQLVALELWHSPIPTAAILLTTFAVNLRLVLMAASLADWLRGAGTFRAYASALFMGDEAWALTVGRVEKGERDRAFFVGSGLCLYISWLTASLLGHALGRGIDPDKWGLDFAFTAVFIALLMGLWRGRGDLLPWLVSAGVAVIVERMVAGPWYILAGGLVGSLVGAWRGGR